MPTITIPADARWWTESLGRINLRIGLADAQSVAQPGPNDAAVAELRTLPYIAEQCEAIDPATLRASLREYGAWDADELSDHAANLERILWCASWDIVERFNAGEDDTE